jgi:tetratricopeptide (TPR) repeat protein
MANPDFIRGVKANVLFWAARTKIFDDEAFQLLDSERQNVYRAIQAGLSFPETQEIAAQLAVNIYDFIEIRSQWHEWIPILKLALNANHPPALQCRLLNQLGYFHSFAKKFPEAIAYHHQAQELAHVTHTRREWINSYFGLCHVYFKARNYAQAEENGQYALRLFLASSDILNTPLDQSKLGAIHNHLGAIAQARGDYPVAEIHLSQTVQIRRQLPNSLLLAQALNELGITLQSLNKFDQVLAGYQEALDLLSNGKNTFVYSQTLFLLGGMYFIMERYDEAEATFLKVDSSFLHQTGNLLGIATRANNLGNVYLKQNRLGHAEQFLTEAIFYWRQTGDEIELANTLGDLAETLFKLNRPDEALPLYLEALQLLARNSQNAWARGRWERMLAQAQQNFPHEAFTA